MIIRIKVPTHLGVYKLSKRARARVVSNLMRQRRKLYDLVGVKIEKIIIFDEKKGRPENKLQPTLL